MRVVVMLLQSKQLERFRMKTFLNFTFGSYKSYAKAIEKEFNRGYEVGIFDGKQTGMEQMFRRTKELPKEEYNEIIEFLISRGVELCGGYDGLQIRKRIYK